jgi:hypothetical protein
LVVWARADELTWVVVILLGFSIVVISTWLDSRYQADETRRDYARRNLPRLLNMLIGLIAVLGLLLITWLLDQGLPDWLGIALFAALIIFWFLSGRLTRRWMQRLWRGKG